MKKAGSTGHRVILLPPLLLLSLLVGCAAREHRAALLDVVMEERSAPPFVCQTGYHPGGANTYVTNLTPWAEQAGLRKSDRIISENHKANESLTLTIERESREMTITLPCRDPSMIRAPWRRVEEAVRHGDWKECEQAISEIERLSGLITSTTTLVSSGCVLEQGDQGRYASAWHRHALIKLREARYEPGALDRIRGHILHMASIFRQKGYASFASDVETEVQRVAAEPTRSPSTALPAKSQGTAFLVAPDGTLLTAFHVVRGARTMTVSCAGSSPASAVLVGTSQSTDLAMLRASALANSSHLGVTSARFLRVGETVFTIGFPVTSLLGSEPKFTSGSVSALSGPGGEATLIQVSVPLQPGNSGGPLITEDGQVVGVITSSAAIRPFLSATGTLPQNVNWAVKADYAIPLLGQAPRPRGTPTKTEAIDQAIKATCMIEAAR